MTRQPHVRREELPRESLAHAFLAFMCVVAIAAAVVVIWWTQMPTVTP